MAQKPISSYFTSGKNITFNDKKQFVGRKICDVIETIEKNTNIDSLIQENETLKEKNQVLNEEKRILEKNLKQAKILLRKASDLNLQNDLQINMLKKQLDLQGKKHFTDDQILFVTHSERFAQNDFKRIRSVRAGRRNDAVFVRFVMNGLYKNEETKLSERRASSRKYKGSSKLEVSADKKQIIRDMLEERIVQELGNSTEDLEFDGRFKRLNDLIRFALNNSSNKKKRTNEKIDGSCPKPPETACSQINQGSNAM